MSLEQEIKELREAVVFLTAAVLKMANDDVPTLKADSAQALEVPNFLKEGQPDLVTKQDEGPGLITDDAGMSEEIDLNPRSVAAKKAAKTRATNKAKKEAERKVAKEVVEVVSETVGEDIEEDFLSEEDEDFPGFLEDEQVEEDPFFAEAEAETQAPAGLSVMGEEDPRGTLRKYLVTISKAFQVIGQPAGLAELMQNKEAGFGYTGFPQLPEEKFDAFLNAALAQLPEAERAKIG